MRSRKPVCLLVCAAALFATVSSARAFTAEEHRHLARRAFAPLLERLNVSIAAESLATISAQSSRDDLSRSRHQVRGLTPYQQAAAIPPQRMAAFVAAAVSDSAAAVEFRPLADNVVANYLACHSIALKCIEKSYGGAGGEGVPRVLPGHTRWIERALVYEAIAIGYLADAFSSSHMLTPVHRPFSALQRTNVRDAHAFFSTHGAYVVNSMGEVWQSFGDGLLQWYGPAYRHVLDACQLSVAGLARAVEYPDRPGGASGMLLWIPTVVVATWNVDGAHYLQFREEGLHDPDLRVDRRFLYSRDAVPLDLPEKFNRTPPAVAMRTDPALTSVSYYQTLDAAPAFDGLLVMAGVGALDGDDGGGGIGSAGLGYAWGTPVPLVDRLQTSVELQYLYRAGTADRRVLSPRYCLAPGAPLVPGLESFHFEAGYAWGLESPYDDNGFTWGVGINTRPLGFPFTNAGIGFRFTFERLWIDDTLDGFQLQLIFR